MPALHRVLALLPELEVVMLMGRAAWRSWARYQWTYPEAEHRLLEEPIRTYHTSRQAYFCPSEQRAQRIEKHRVDFAKAAHLIGPPTPDPRRTRRSPQR